MYVEEKQISTNYEVVILLTTLNNKTTHKISVNFKLYNYIFYNTYLIFYLKLYA